MLRAVGETVLVWMPRERVRTTVISKASVWTEREHWQSALLCPCRLILGTSFFPPSTFRRSESFKHKLSLKWVKKNDMDGERNLAGGELSIIVATKQSKESLLLLKRSGQFNF